MVLSGLMPSGENVVRWARETEPPAGTLTLQLSPAPLSTALLHCWQRLGSGVPVPTALQTALYPDS